MIDKVYIRSNDTHVYTYIYIHKDVWYLCRTYVAYMHVHDMIDILLLWIFFSMYKQIGHVFVYVKVSTNTWYYIDDAYITYLCMYTSV